MMVQLTGPELVLAWVWNTMLSGCCARDICKFESLGSNCDLRGCGLSLCSDVWCKMLANLD